MSATPPARHSREPKRVPFRFLGNQVRIDATIRGTGPFRLILDTGMPMAGVLLFRNPRVAALRLEDSGRRVRIAGAGGDGAGSDAAMATGVTVSFGELEIEATSALVIPEPPGFPPGIDGVVGGELFSRFVVRIDMQEQRLALRDPAGWTPPAGASVLPLERVGGRIFLGILVAVLDEAPVAAQVVVDTGAGHALSLNAREDGRFLPPPSSIEASLGRGASGVLLGQVGRVRRVELGPFSFTDVVASFPIGKHQKAAGEDFRDGNLGEEILRRFDVTFDCAGGRMVLAQGLSFGEPFDREMSGLAFDWEKDGSLRVREVLSGSPAAEAGIEAGDRLLSIDGRRTADLGDHGLEKALSIDGAEVRLSLQRGFEVLPKKIRLRRLV